MRRELPGRKRRMPPPAIRLLMAAVALLFIDAIALPAQTANPGTASGTLTLAQARQAMAKVLGKDSFRVNLESNALALQSADAVAFLLEFVPKAPETQKSAAVDFAGALALILGRIDQAARIYELTSASNPAHLLAAARCRIATGDVEGARFLLSKLPAEAGAELQGAKRMALAWASFSEGDRAGAYRAAKSVWETERDRTARRESLYLVWITASAPDSASYVNGPNPLSAEKAEALLKAEYPDSVEYGLVVRKVALAPASWLLWGLYPDQAIASDSAGLASGDEENEGTASASPARLQVGWFSRKENAQSLAATLKAKGFTVEVEEQKTKAGEPRWAVIVQTRGGWADTQAKLKDLGYESYLVP